MAAVAKGHLKTVRVLLDAGANVNAQPPGGPTALMVAVRTIEPDSENILDLLLERRADVHARDSSHGGDTALHHAARELNEWAIVALLDADADCNARGFLDATPLLEVAHAAKLGAGFGPEVFELSADVAEWLILDCPDVNLANGLKVTPLMAASRTGNINLVHLLLKEGAKVTAESGSRALSGAIQGGHAKVVELLKRAGARQ
jgi:ankyrin repeat protein